ncbi:MAG TPA: hypothetical protein VK669_12815, partial [Candidatus Limnocylindrales bacterium]|nr:hypothetical protein [Candidatus Limnocylindrales bacterium]
MISMPRGAGPQLSAEHPFPGLRPFRFNDREFFFGREDQIYALYRLLELSRFVAVIGSSGSGKSSLVRAGLLPLLQEESESAGERAWRSVVLSPGDAPLSSLADALMSLAPAGESAESLTDHEIRRDRIRLALRRSSFGLAEALDEIPGARDTSLLIVVDQFEELFRFASPAGTGAAERIAEALWRDEAVSFVQQLLQITSGRERSVHVLVTMRSDFIGDCARFHGLPEAVSAAQFLTPSLSRDQWEDVIRRPIEKAGASIESALVERLLIDIATEPDPLPVLQHCLARLWEKAGEGERAPHQRRFELGAYIEIGGVANALSKHADEVMSRDLPGPELELAVQQVFRALSEVDKEGRAKRRALPYAQLRDEAGVPEADLRNVLDRFRAEDVLFIVPPLSEMRMLQDQTRVDVVHEALLRRWDKISPETGHKLADDALDSGWLAAEDADGRLYRALLALLDGGSESGPVTLPGEQVGSRWRWWTSRPRTEAWAKRYGGRLAEVNKLFADSRAEVEAARQRDEAALAARSEARRNRAIVLWALPALLIAVGFAIFAFFQMNSARANEQLARKNERLAIEANANMRAALKAKDAAQKNAVVEARRAVYQAEAASAARSKAEAQEKIAQIAMTRARRESAAANAATERAMRAADRANKDEARVKALSSAAVRAARLQAKAELRLRAAQVAAQRTRALVASLQVAAYATGVVYEARDQYTDAITEFDQAIRLKPQDYTAWSARGWSYRALRKNDLAITDLKTALRLNPKDRLSLSRLAQIYVDQRNYDEAIR